MIRELYKKCIEAAGIVGSSVRTVDNGKIIFFSFCRNLMCHSFIARSTKLILGKAPSLFMPALQNNRLKQDLLHNVKSKTYPFGTDIPGMFLIHLILSIIIYRNLCQVSCTS